MDFQSEKSFEKLRHRAFQPYHQILCILKHVGDVRDRSSTPKGCNAMYVGDHNNLQYTQDLMVWLKSPKAQLSKTFFGLKIHWILSKLWAKTSLTTRVQQCYSCLMSEMSEMWNISIKDQRQHCTQQCYSCRRCRRCEISQCYVITVLRYFTSPTSPTWVTLLCIVLPLIFYWDISHLRHLRHALLWSFVLTILTNPLMYTQQIRWQWVWMSGFLTI